MDKKGKILIVDDNEDVLFALNVLLSNTFEKVKVAMNPERIEHFMETFHPDVILLDMNFQHGVSSGQEGINWLQKILKIDPEAMVVLMTAYADTEKAVQVIKAGAIDFVPKPWEKEKLLATLSSALKLKDSRNEVTSLKKQVEVLSGIDTTCEIIGESEPMLEIFSMIEKLSDTEANVLILGENGTGKDLVARAIYQNSPRSKEVFVGIDLGAIPDSLFESELFGHEKGAFTGAQKEKPGRMEAASGGTLFLDEIANLSVAMQAKMLTAIEKRYISRLGSTKNISIDIRFICATNADIYQDVEEGKFRQDLLYRINTIEMHIPPLRERGNDIILLAEHFLQKFAHKYKKNIIRLSNDAKTKLLAYGWPGNVRELQHAVERAVILSGNHELGADNFILQSVPGKRRKNDEQLNLERLEYDAIKKALQYSAGNLTKAAEMLGITRYALYRKVNKLGL